MASLPNGGVATTSLTLTTLLASLDGQKPDFISSTRTKVYDYIAAQERTTCVSIVEADGLSAGNPRTHRPGLDSYLKVFGCFIAREPYHTHALDSALSVPIASIVSDNYGAFLGSHAPEIEGYFLSRITGDEVVRKTLMAHVATELCKKGVKTARGKLTHLLIQSMTQHAAHTHVGIAVQHSVALAASHTTIFAAGTSVGSAAGSVIAALLVKALTMHIGVILPKLISSAAFKGIIMAATHKVVCVTATVAAANMLAAKFGAAGAATFAHLIVGPLAAGVIAYKIKNLPKDLGRSISNGVTDDLEGTFRSLTQTVIEGMKEEVCNMDAMAAAVVGEIITVDNWERQFENMDTPNPSTVELNHAVAADGSYASNLRKMMKAQAKVPATTYDDEAPPPYRENFVCYVCAVDLGPLEERDQQMHLNQCLDAQRQVERLVCCWVCLESLMGMEDMLLEQHMNRCLNRRAPRAY
ncbi:hypothetical protein MMC34_006622 [Xylographa carneopallida]|nr:hypothetical protein [Xylographa carneopallida]